MNNRTDYWSVMVLEKSLFSQSLIHSLSSIRIGSLTLVWLLVSASSLQSCLKETMEVAGCNTTTYLHTDPISVASQAIITGANLINYNKEKNQIEYDSVKSRSPDPPSEVIQKYTVTTAIVQDRRVVTLAPKSGSTGQYVLFIHGGGYVSGLSEGYYTGHFSSIIDRTGATIIAPDYGLAPYYSYVQAYALVQAVYDSLARRVGAQHVTLMGDSAGGGLALGFAQTLKNQGKSQPRQIILLSPWLDITLSNPAINNIQDPVLNAPSLREDGKSWAGATDPTYYQLSPINGPLEGLAKINLFIGGRDMFLPDAIKLRDRMGQRCLPLTVYEYPQMFHVWMGFSGLPEAKKAQGEIADLIN